LGLSTQEFFRLTWAEYNAKVQHHRKQDERLWAHDRVLLATLWNTRLGAKGEVKPTDIIHLSIDDDNPDIIPALTEEEIRERMRGMETIFDRLKPKNYKPGK
jgi:hypothetical protein